MKQETQRYTEIEGIEVLQQKLDGKIEVLHEYFKEFGNGVQSDKIQEIKDRKNEYKIAVVANMSAGKSTFINALLDKKILAVDTRATTDCATFIHLSKNEKRARIVFEDKNRKEVILDLSDNESIESLQQYSIKDSDAKDDKYKGVEEIHLHYPFMENLDLNYDVVLIDTPGPNSTNSEESQTYAEKHCSQTAKVLQDANLALFLFDLGQLDANLKHEQDPQNLWNTIKERKEKTTNNEFEVFFLLNKIDQQLKTEIENLPNEDDLTPLIKKIKAKNNGKIDLNCLIQDSLDKLKNRANKILGIEDAKVYPIASRAYLSRNSRKGIKGDFKELYANGEIYNIEEEYLKYCGIEPLQKDILHHLNTTAKIKLMQTKLNQLREIEKEEGNRLKNELETLSKPKSEAEQNVKRAKHFLEQTIPNERENLNRELISIQSNYLNKIEKIIQERLDFEFDADIMARKTMAFLETYCQNGIKKFAIKNAENNYSNYKTSGKYSITIMDADIKEAAQQAQQEYQQELINKSKQSYSNTRIDIHNPLYFFSKECTIAISEYECNINKGVAKELQVELDNEEEKVEIKDIALPDIDIQTPDSVLSYESQEHTYKKEKDVWFGRKFTNWLGFTNKEHEYHITTEHKVIVDADELKANIEGVFNNTKDSVLQLEKNNYDNLMQSVIYKYIEGFNKGVKSKQDELSKLEEKLKESIKNLEEVQNQQNKFNTSVKKDKYE